MLRDLTPSQRELADYMSELSEEAYCAGWMHDLEYELWQVLQSDSPSRFGRLVASDDQLYKLRSLSSACEGWIHFDDAREETWLSFAEWQPLYESWLGHQRRTPPSPFRD